ncbi:DUF1761 domain-containing protein [Spirilliplanes yamanashiensis]|uniref:DUF1761 domain-containing protein n=1 Tax=Spirilliplanes yamanashiensis TaxID=42233 RepID=A0A8J4DIK2_9ACTN|nr:DUF1761 domain-containing protein [Spirilliplanes yamanashiensis]MDP9817501.1 hypothetical protein [Spirilliplanes yamanashiensis]GIJ02846.1 hypothetical protein Sya03_21980 [Spirilliplanes yamanashiensis]
MTSTVLAAAVATVAAFLLGAAWYAAFGATLARLSPAHAGDRPARARDPLLELLRCAVLATVVVILLRRLDPGGAAAAAGTGLLLWAGFPAVLLAGSVLHDGVPWRPAAVHAGDWLVKLVVISLIAGLWP